MLLKPYNISYRHARVNLFSSSMRMFGLKRALLSVKPKENENLSVPSTSSQVNASDDRLLDIFPPARMMPLVLSNKEPEVLSFDDVPGPKALKYLSTARNYLSGIGTQITANILTLGLNIGTLVNNKKPIKNISVLFDEYGPVVRFVSPIGGDIVLLNHPDHIQKVYTMEGDYPVRSTLESLEKYRQTHRSGVLGGLLTAHGPEWYRQREIVYTPLKDSSICRLDGIDDVCDSLVEKINNIRNPQDEIPKDLYREIHKWAFDCMGLVLFSKRFTMVNTELVYSQCDMSWLYYSLEKATEAILKCESGFRLWKLVNTPAWNSLVKYCDSLDVLIGKHVVEAEQAITYRPDVDNAAYANTLINSMLLTEDKMSAQDITTVIMDMLLIGVNTITSSMSFLLYHLAKYQRAQNALYKEIQHVYSDAQVNDFKNIRGRTPYLQACIKETLRLVPPIPVVTRILSKNVILDKYNIPRGTLIIMSPKDASLKESNYEDAKVFYPERWLKPEAKEYHSFASIPFGFGARKCLGQDMAENVMSVLIVKLMQKYKLEYHYGDIEPKMSFIAKPNRPLRIRFVDRTV